MFTIFTKEKQHFFPEKITTLRAIIQTVLLSITKAATKKINETAKKYKGADDTCTVFVCVCVVIRDLDQIRDNQFFSVYLFFTPAASVLN